MAIFYKHFKVIRIVFYACFLCLFITPAFAGSVLFTIEDIKVDVTAANAMAAREQAFEQAQVLAFNELAERMTAGGAGQNVPVPDLSTISSLIQDFEVTSESLSAVRYVGTYIFRFKDADVRRFFSNQGVAYTDVSSRPMLVLPFYQRPNGEAVIWSPYNIWMQAWDKVGDLEGLVPLVVPLGDLADVRDIGDDEALTYNESKLSGMLNRYGAGEAVVVVAIPDENLARVEGPDTPAAGALGLDIYRTDRAGPEYVQRIIQTARSGQTRAQFYEEAVKKVYSYLQRDWKKKTLVSGEQGNRKLRVRVTFNSLEEWATTQKALERVYGISEVSLQSLSPKEAYVNLSFQGAESRLRLALKQADITLDAPRTDARPLEAGGLLSQPPVYNLYLNRYTPRQGG